MPLPLITRFSFTLSGFSPFFKKKGVSSVVQFVVPVRGVCNPREKNSPLPGLTCRWPRYADGAGVDIMLYNLVAHATAGTSNITLGYTNSAGTASRATPATVPANLTSVPIFSVPYSGTAAAKYGPGIPRQSPDAGVRSLQTLTTSGNLSSGAWAVLAYRPLLTLPITTIGVASERDLL